MDERRSYKKKKTILGRQFNGGKVKFPTTKNNKGNVTRRWGVFTMIIALPQSPY